ncbi:hypothetical protein FOA52_014664 [Chlamydomonas sp. UWO 241]|nr:hypothetical protein FOA52_014664 [Chlamydomonas sp. UWO 241]
MAYQQGPSPFDLLAGDSPLSSPAGAAVLRGLYPRPDEEDAQASVRESVAYAVSALRGWGVHVDVPGGGEWGSSGGSSPAPSPDPPPSAVCAVLSAAVAAAQAAHATRAAQAERTARLQSDLRSSQSMRQVIEDEKEATARALGRERNKARTTEDAHRKVMLQLQSEKEQLARALRDAKMRAKQQDNALRASERELNEQARQLSAAAGSSCGGGGGASDAALAAAMRHGGGGSDGGGGAHRNGSANGAAAAARERRAGRGGAGAVPPPAGGGGGGGAGREAAALQLRLGEVHRELHGARAARMDAEGRLKQVCARAEALGFAQALGLGSLLRQPVDHSSGAAAAEAQATLLASLPAVQERARRWLRHTDAAAGHGGEGGGGGQGSESAQLAAACELLAQQDQALSAAVAALSRSQDAATTAEARCMALEARLEVAVAAQQRAVAAQQHAVAAGDTAAAQQQQAQEQRQQQRGGDLRGAQHGGGAAAAAGRARSPARRVPEAAAAPEAAPHHHHYHHGHSHGHGHHPSQPQPQHAGAVHQHAGRLNASAAAFASSPPLADYPHSFGGYSGGDPARGVEYTIDHSALSPSFGGGGGGGGCYSGGSGGSSVSRRRTISAPGGKIDLYDNSLFGFGAAEAHAAGNSGGGGGVGGTEGGGGWDVGERAPAAGTPPMRRTWGRSDAAAAASPSLKAQLTFPLDASITAAGGGWPGRIVSGGGAHAGEGDDDGAPLHDQFGSGHGGAGQRREGGKSGSFGFRQLALDLSLEQGRQLDSPGSDDGTPTLLPSTQQPAAAVGRAAW